MTKKELVDLIADKRDLSAQMVLTVVEDFMKIIQSSVADGQRIFLRGFGVFQPKERKAKVGRNITRGEQLSIPPKRVPQFRPTLKKSWKRVSKNSSPVLVAGLL